MRRTNRLKTLLPAVLAFALVLGSTAAPSLSYFTTYVTATGSKQLVLKGTDITIDEKVDNSVKSVQVQSTGEMECYARVRVYCPLAEGREDILTFTDTGDVGGTWTLAGDGYWYYSEPLQPGELSSTLKIQISLAKLKEAGVDVDLSGQDINVVVLAECAPVLYDDTGRLPNGPDYEGWTLTPEVKEGKA